MTDEASLRALRVQTLETAQKPADIRRVTGYILTVQKDPADIRAARVQFIEEARTPSEVRKVTGYALTLRQDPVTLRGVRALFLELQITKPDFRNEAWGSLLAKINQTNNTNFTTTQLGHGKPVVSDGTRSYNTLLQVTANRSSGFSGSVWVNYHRWRIEEIILDNKPVLDYTGVSKVSDLLPQLNALHSLGLTAGDIVDQPVDVASQSFALVISDSCLYFVGGSRVNFGDGVFLDTVMAVGDLSGFTRVEGPSLEQVITTADLTGFTKVEGPPLGQAVVTADLTGFDPVTA